MKAKKSLGQNWLKSDSAIREIIKAGELKPADWVIEIGPGQGALTTKLLAEEAHVLAIEKDSRLISLLTEKFKQQIKNKKLHIIEGDIMDFDIEKELEKLKIKKYKLIANIPYYITGQIIRKFLSEVALKPSLFVLMLQKEVAKRIVAQDEKESLLSISVKVYGEPQYIKTIPAGAFEPKPKVDSAILKIKTLNKGSEAKRGEEIIALAKKGFSQKRKLLKSNLSLSEEALNICRIPQKARAEDLNLEDWYCLAKSKEN